LGALSCDVIFIFYFFAPHTLTTLAIHGEDGMGRLLKTHYVCIYTYIHTYVCIYIYKYIYFSIYMYKYIYLYEYIYLYMYTYIHI
jgi:hypothetical protein